MNTEFHAAEIEYRAIELKARQLRADALAYGIKASLAWVSHAFSTITHRSGGRTA